MKNRNTLQRRLVLETVQHMHNHPTADEIFQTIAAENALISKATVYRNLKILSEQGEILHIPMPNSADRFDFHTAPHYHMECRCCLGVFDIDMPYQTDLYDKITDQGDFLIDSHHIVFGGLCPACRKKAAVQPTENIQAVSAQTDCRKTEEPNG